MSVSKKLAQDIVEDMKDIINQEINYFDNEGMLIASTDETRVGSYHGGAKRVIEEKKDLIVTYDGEYEGAKKGINIPIYFNDGIVGVIGITGEKIEVEKYGKIIQKMTEILIKEAYIKEQKEREKEIEGQFVEELLFRYYSDYKPLLNRAELLNLENNRKRIVIVARTIAIEDKGYLEVGDEIFNFIRSHIKFNPQNLIVQSGMNIIVVYELMTKDNIDRLILKIKESIEKKYNELKIYFGIGTDYENLIEVKKSYKEAKKALDVGIALRKKEIIYYKNLDLGLLIHDLPKETINNYIEKVLGGLGEDELSRNEEMIYTYIKNNGSIEKSSEELFIHKNTLQYRLDKFYNDTGYNPRNLGDITVIYLAFVLIRMEIDN